MRLSKALLQTNYTIIIIFLVDFYDLCFFYSLFVCYSILYFILLNVTSRNKFTTVHPHMLTGGKHLISKFDLALKHHGKSSSYRINYRDNKKNRKSVTISINLLITNIIGFNHNPIQWVNM